MVDWGRHLQILYQAQPLMSTPVSRQRWMGDVLESGIDPILYMELALDLAS